MTLRNPATTQSESDVRSDRAPATYRGHPAWRLSNHPPEPERLKAYGIRGEGSARQINGGVERAGQRASGLRFADPRRTTGLELETSGSVPIAKGDGSQVRSGLADGGRSLERTRLYFKIPC